MAKFRKKPIVIEAFQWTGINVAELTTWASHADLESKKARGLIGPRSNGDVLLPIDVISLGDGSFALEIATPEGRHRATSGDWIICGVAGEFYPCKPDIFAATYTDDDALYECTCPMCEHHTSAKEIYRR